MLLSLLEEKEGARSMLQISPLLSTYFTYPETFDAEDELEKQCERMNQDENDVDWKKVDGDKFVHLFSV